MKKGAAAVLKKTGCWAMVAHLFNPRYMGGLQSQAALVHSSRDPHLHTYQSKIDQRYGSSGGEPVLQV
jgi:hypothetical protein